MARGAGNFWRTLLGRPNGRRCHAPPDPETPENKHHGHAGPRIARYLLDHPAVRAGLSDEAMRGELQRVVVLNMGSLAVSALGLMVVVMGIVLG